MPLIGEQRNNCFLFILAPDEKINSATVKHSNDGIHYLSFVTSNGQTKAVGSTSAGQQTMETTVVDFAGNGYDTLLGAYGHVKKFMGEQQIQSIGFLVNACAPGWSRPSRERLAIQLREQREAESDGNERPLVKKWITVDEGEKDSKIRQREQDELVEEESSLAVVIFILITLCACCICGYFILKNRGKCFRKLSHEERDEDPIPGNSMATIDLSARSR